MGHSSGQWKHMQLHMAGFYISKYLPPQGFKYSSHSPNDLRSTVNAGVINKQKYAQAGTQLSASEMGIKDS